MSEPLLPVCLKTSLIIIIIDDVGGCCCSFFFPLLHHHPQMRQAGKRAHRRPPLTESAAAICSSTVACSSLPDAPQHWCFTCSGSFLWSLYSCTLHVNVRKHPFSFTALGKNKLSALHQLICRNSSVVVDLLIFLLFRVLELF